jgi:hypothetical protein
MSGSNLSFARSSTVEACLQVKEMLLQWDLCFCRVECFLHPLLRRLERIETCGKNTFPRSRAWFTSVCSLARGAQERPAQLGMRMQTVRVILNIGFVNHTGDHDCYQGSSRGIIMPGCCSAGAWTFLFCVLRRSGLRPPASHMPQQKQLAHPKTAPMSPSV